MFISTSHLVTLVEALVSVTTRLCYCLLYSFANKQDEASALSNQDICDRLGVEELIDNAGIDQCQVVSGKRR